MPLGRQTIDRILQPADPQGQEGQRKRVRRSFLDTFRRAAGAVPFTQDLLASYYCALDPRTPVASRGILLAALAYFVLPTDIIPDFAPLIGFTDDAAVLMAAIAAVRANIAPRHYSRARRFLKRDTTTDGV
ncbi:YkvA family protein [Aureimonas frigidaquae]|uniref:YkvA family protein n=1 Tax=Aureimonas frigidaquae TaxID=424757 RepID=UPI00078357F6|nr:YkvA family protein [Aureimonas frigidaquae]